MPVRNPAGRRARSNPPTAPVQVTEGNVQFSLLSLRCGVSPRTPWTFVARPATAVFRVAENGEPSAFWTLRSLEGVGDTGNRFFIGQPAVERSFQQLSVTFPEVLWPEEPGWKILAEFSRTREHGADASITVKDVVAARTNLPFTTNLQAEAEGVIVQSVDLRGTSQIRRYVRGLYVPNSDLTLVYTAKVQRAQVYLARALDDQGRELRFGHETHPWQGKYTAAVEIPHDSQTVNLTFAIHRSQFVEFRVRPVWGKANEAGPSQQDY